MSGNCANPGAVRVAEALRPCSVGPEEVGVQLARVSPEIATPTNTPIIPFFSIARLYHGDYGLVLPVIRSRQELESRYRTLLLRFSYIW